jgi:hypothetical protein
LVGYERQPVGVVGHNAIQVMEVLGLDRGKGLFCGREVSRTDVLPTILFTDKILEAVRPAKWALGIK